MSETTFLMLNCLAAPASLVPPSQLLEAWWLMLLPEAVLISLLSDKCRCPRPQLPVLLPPPWVWRIAPSAVTTRHYPRLQTFTILLPGSPDRETQPTVTNKLTFFTSENKRVPRGAASARRRRRSQQILFTFKFCYNRQEEWIMMKWKTVLSSHEFSKHVVTCGLCDKISGVWKCFLRGFPPNPKEIMALCKMVLRKVCCEDVYFAPQMEECCGFSS